MGVNVPTRWRHVCRETKIIDYQQTDQRVDQTRGCPDVGQSGIEHDQVARPEVFAQLLRPFALIAVGRARLADRHHHRWQSEPDRLGDRRGGRQPPVRLSGRQRRGRVFGRRPR
jgi:hypothetical protein